MRLVTHPILCNYYVTYRCNAKCGFCDIWERPSPYAQPEVVGTVGTPLTPTSTPCTMVRYHYGLGLLSTLIFDHPEPQVGS